MSKLVLGLDIGVSSVGWAITNKETGVVIDCGVRLFEEGLAAENVKRREKRSGRRIKRRKSNRLSDLRKLLIKYDIEVSNDLLLNNPYEVRVKGLTEKLSQQELATALYHLVKKRGSSLEVVEEETNEDTGATKQSLSENDRLIRAGQYICEIQLDRLNSSNKVKGHQNNFRTIDYVKEAEKILSNQCMSDDFNEAIIHLIGRRRHFSEGPGSEKSPTIYGRYILNEHGEIEVIDLIEKMRGKCSVFPTEPRAPKLAPTSELFNFLNDLNNLSINHEKISSLQKKEIIEQFILQKKHRITPKELAKFLEVSPDDVTGFRQDKKDKPMLTEFIGLKLLLSCVEDEDRKLIYTDNFSILDEIAEILTRTKVVDERVKEILNIAISFITEEDARKFALLPKFSQYHSISLRAMNEMMPDLYNTSDNQMQILARKHLAKSSFDKYKGLHEIPLDNEAVLSPVAKKSQREALAIVNKVRKDYGELSEIVIEMARDKNSDEQKKREKKVQGERDEQNKKTHELANKEINLKTRIKISLYLQQDGKCLYTGDALDLNQIIDDPTAYEIDHIIPISISLDDSLQNRALVTHAANQRKGNRTPLAAIRSGLYGWSEDQYRSYVNMLHKTRKITEKKRDYLLFDEPIDKFSTMKSFINRNLVDTRYASRTVLNTLQGYFNANGIPTKVVTIRGSVTSAFRSHIGIKKDRDENFLHHAVDAATISLVTMQKHLEHIFNSIKVTEVGADIQGDDAYNPNIDYSEYFNEPFMKCLSQLRELNDRTDIKVSHKVDKKPNRQVSDETIYSTRLVDGNEKVVKKYKDIYNPNEVKCALSISNGEYERFLMYRHDPKTFQKLIDIVDHYVKEFGEIKKENPFFVFAQEHGKIRKYAKDGNGPEVVSLKYFDGNLGNHIPVTHNYESHANEAKRKNVVLLQISPYRTDFYKSKSGQYKFVTIRYSNIQYFGEKKKYVINQDWYEDQLDAKGIDDTYEFEFSLNRNEYIEIEQTERQKDGTLVVNTERYRFIATNNDKTNSIEVKPITHYEPKQLMKTIGRKTTKLTKCHHDRLGNLYRSANEVLQLELD